MFLLGSGTPAGSDHPEDRPSISTGCGEPRRRVPRSRPVPCSLGKGETGGPHADEGPPGIPCPRSSRVLPLPGLHLQRSRADPRIRERLARGDKCHPDRHSFLDLSAGEGDMGTGAGNCLRVRRSGARDIQPWIHAGGRAGPARLRIFASGRHFVRRVYHPRKAPGRA